MSAGTVRVEAIAVGERRREDYGDIAGLAASIQKYGLLHPVVIDGDGALVAGGRRLQAVKALGWTDVPVRSLGELTDAGFVQASPTKRPARRRALVIVRRTSTKKPA